jgi:hypothetical protein
MITSRNLRSAPGYLFMEIQDWGWEEKGIGCLGERGRRQGIWKK